jgi:hypothetical protein
MKKSFVTAALMLTCLLAVGRAQDANAVIVSVPFEFVAGGALLPAGEYRVSRTNPGTNRELAINGYDKGNAFLLAVTFEDAFASHPNLSFEHVGGKYFLSKIKTPEGVYTLPAPREMIRLGQVNIASPGASSSSGGH